MFGNHIVCFFMTWHICYLAINTWVIEKIDLSPPVILYYLSFQGDTAVVVLSFYVLVLKIFVLLAPYVCFHISS